VVDWCYIFSISKLGVYPLSVTVYNVGSKTTWHQLALFKEAAKVETTLKCFRTSSS
jgi:hypothetical protein